MRKGFDVALANIASASIPSVGVADSPSTPGLADPLLLGLVIIARFHGVVASPAQIAHEHCLSGGLMSVPQLLTAFKTLGLHARSISTPLSRIERLSLPAICLDREGRHFIIARISKDRVLTHDLLSGKPKVVSREEFEARYSSEVVAITSRSSLAGEAARFDFTWFIPAIVKYRKVLGEVLISSLFVQIFALITPLFFQVVMDKVLVHSAYTTLTVITVALCGVVIFNAALSVTRAHILAHTTSRLDVELGSQLFRRLLHLPLAYFEARRVGDTVARVRELENIRSFLTGQALTSLLDMLFSFIFIAVMFAYSPMLTLAVIISLPLYALISTSITPGLRRRLEEKFSRGASNQSFLVEAVSGIGTIKSMALSPRLIRTWDSQLAGYVKSGFQVAAIANIGQQAIQLVQKSLTICILYWGARQVISGDMSVGQLVAFNMLAGQVATPVLRLAQLWQDFQQVGVSVERLGDILNAKTEIPSNQAVMPKIDGAIKFEGVRFRYAHDSPPVLDGLDIQIHQGEVIGIVGKSGSGKSTLTKLVQRLYVPESGRILVDGHDIALIDPAGLRRQLGVVLQDSFLFNRTIRENIAISDPGMAVEHVIGAAKLAGAHEFISELPHGYETPVGEHGAALSGGQRQRIAIARALVGNPRVLIFDEATSALDYESERAVMSNMRAICKGRTVLIIAHRLSTVRRADRIFVLERGHVVETGSPSDLLENPAGHFYRLSQLQQG